MTVFVEQPLALPGSAKYKYQNIPFNGSVANAIVLRTLLSNGGQWQKMILGLNHYFDKSLDVQPLGEYIVRMHKFNSKAAESVLELQTLGFWYQLSSYLRIQGRLSKCHKMYTTIISDQKLYPKDVGDTTNKCKHPAHFSKAKLVCSRFATIYYSNVINFLQIYPNLQKFTS